MTNKTLPRAVALGYLQDYCALSGRKEKKNLPILHRGPARQHGLKSIFVTVILPSWYFVQPLQGCKFFMNFTTGFGLWPTPAAIIVMTPPGSGEEKLRERLQK